jgi:hypothetical protein
VIVTSVNARWLKTMSDGRRAIARQQVAERIKELSNGFARQLIAVDLDCLCDPLRPSLEEGERRRDWP